MLQSAVTQTMLVIRVSARNIADLRRVLDSLDRMPRRLLITVRQSADSGGSAQGGVVYGSTGGAAGGGAFNQAGALIGILGQDRYLPTAEVAQLRPLELALPVIDRAKKETGRYVAPLVMRANAPGTTKTAAGAATMWISAPVFAANAIQTASSRDLFDYNARFPAGRPALYYEYVLEGVPTGTVIDERWFLDDAPQDAISSSYRWDGRSFAIQGDRITAPSAAGIPAGRWRLEIWAGGSDRMRTAIARSVLVG